jgi:signal transduction histidine kinase
MFLTQLVNVLREQQDETSSPLISTMDARDRNVWTGGRGTRRRHAACGPLLASAVANLVQNALKFTRAGGRVSIDTSRSGARVHIAVEDECGGLPDGEEKEPFPSSERRAKDRTGLGLGSRSAAPP